MLTPEENAALDELNGLSSEIAETLQSPWEPACVAAAFASCSPRTFVLTMQVWIDLENARSPVIRQELPANLDACAEALRCFGAEPEKILTLSPEEAAVMAEEMVLAVAEAFAMRQPMSPPTRDESSAETDDGLGEWLTVWSCLVVHCGIPPDAALALPAGRAFALIAGMFWHKGYKAAGTPYALRGLAEKEGA